MRAADSIGGEDLAGERAQLLSSDDGGTLLRVIAGDLAGFRGPGSTYTPIAMVHGTVSAGARMVIPWEPSFNALVYVLGERGTIGEQHPIATGQLAVLGAGDALTVAADATQDGRSDTLEVLLLGDRRDPRAARLGFS